MKEPRTTHTKFHPERDAVAIAACKASLGGLIEKIVTVPDCVELHSRYPWIASEMHNLREHYRKKES